MNGHSDSSRTSAEGSRHFPWPTPIERLCEHVPLSSWRRVRGSLDWLALAGHRRGHPMRRREFIAATTALLVSPRRLLAQGTRRRVGFLAMDVVEPTVQKAWLDGLRNHGWIDGRNLIIEYRYAPSQDRLPSFAAELVALSPDVLIAPNPPAAVALKSATASIPIVFVAVADPVGIGLVQSLSRPGGNITGLSAYVAALDHWPAVRLLVDLLNFDGPKFIDQTGGHKPLAERLAFLNPFECCDLVLVLGEFYSDQRVAAGALVVVERPIGNPRARAQPVFQVIALAVAKAISNNLPGVG